MSIPESLTTKTASPEAERRPRLALWQLLGILACIQLAILCVAALIEFFPR